MNIRDSYIHGADGRGVVKFLYFATGVESVLKQDGSANYNTAAGKDLVFQLADTLGTKIGLTIPTLNQNTTGYAAKIRTVTSTSANNHYLTFVDSNNSSAATESVYTSANIYFKPSTGTLTVKGASITAAGGLDYSGIESDTATNADRNIWFSSAVTGTPNISGDFKYNPSTKTLTVGAISGPTIQIGTTTLYLDNTGVTNKLTPDTVINADSTDGTIPSSAAVWAAILNGMVANEAMIFKGFLDGGADAANTIYTPAAETGYTYKVKTAGYINGDYYQVNDTFICTSAQTAAATSSNVSTIKGKWGVIEGNGDFLSIHGGTMYGTLQWNSGTALPEQTNPKYILVIDAFADGGTTKWTSLANLKTALNIATSAVVAKTASTTTQITAAQSDPYYNLMYGGSIVRSIQFKHGSNMSISSTTGGVITFTATDTWRGIRVNNGSANSVGTATTTKSMNFFSSNLTVNYLAAGTSTGQSGSADYFTINLEAKDWTAATSTVAGTAGYMPGAAIADRGKYLRGDGNWVALAPSISNGSDTNTVKITVGGEDSSNYTVPYATKALNDVNNYPLVTYKTYSGTFPPNDGTEQWYTLLTFTNNYYSKSAILEISNRRSTATILIQFYNTNSPYVTCLGYYGIPSAANGGFTGALRIIASGNNAIIQGKFRASSSTTTSYRQLGLKVYTHIPTYWTLPDAITADATAYDSLLANVVFTSQAFTAGHIATYADETYNIGSSSLKYNNIYAKSFVGTATDSDKLDGFHASDFVKASSELANVTKTLKVDTWTTMVAVNTLDAGTYAIQINSETLYAGGIFTVCHGTDTIIDEIPLHVTDTVGTWRPYARISGNNLQMTTNETTGVSRAYIINITKLI